MTGTMDPYAALGVERTASEEEIRQAFKKLAKQHHPDVAGGENETFNGIRKALDVLTDPRARKLYDDFGVLPGDENAAVRLKAVKELGALFASILDQVTTDNIAEVDMLATMRSAVRSHLDSEQRVVGAMIEELQNYTFEVETEQPRRASSPYWGWTVITTWNT